MRKKAESAAAREDKKSSFGKLFYDALVRKGWTQTEFSKRSGVPRDAINKYINYGVTPTSPRMALIAEALGLETSVVLGWSAPGINLAEHRQARVTDDGSVNITTIPGTRGKARLEIYKVVSFDTAIKIAALIEADNAKDAG